MLTAAVASGATSAASSAASSAFSQLMMSIVLGSYNPDYNKENRKRMRYIQHKYSLAYEGGQAGEDPCAIIQKIDPNSKLLMNSTGTKPLNPFPDERAYEDSLVMNFHPVPGHQGRFAASHAMTCIGTIIDYQNNRRRRPWIPGVSSPGKPNDYINMFLEETKIWLRNQMTLDVITAEELSKREKYYTKLKNDNYYWCFPPESEANGIHKVIDFVHDKVKNAFEIVRREEMNKSLQTLFKEMNDHTTNAFEFGKLFLAYLLFFSKKIGSNLTTANGYDGKSIESGKLHYLLEKTTHVVFDTYVKDMEQSQNRISRMAIGNNDMKGIEDERRAVITEEKDTNNSNNKKSPSGYDIAIRGFETTLTSTVFIIKVEDPKGHQWITKRSWSEFEQFHNTLVKEMSEPSQDMELTFPEKKMTLNAITNSTEYNESLAIQLDGYCLQILGIMADFNNRCQNLLAKFLDTKYIIVTGGDRLHYAESISNAFVPIRNVFQRQMLGKQSNSITTASDNQQRKWFGGGGNSNGSGSNSSEAKGNIDVSDDSFVRDILSDKELDEFRRIWGIEYCLKIFEAYASLQRIATVLGWTLEINHFFISMFGNTVTFSRLPLKDIVVTLKELLTKFLGLSKDLYQFACQLNADSKYKWHKNMQMAENELSRVKFHVEKTLAVITTIENDHLDYESQMRRLKDVYARFQPFMNRVGPSLTNITSELGLPPLQYTLAEYTENEDVRRESLMITNGGDCVKEEKGGPTVNIFSRSASETSNIAAEKMNPLRSIEVGKDAKDGDGPRIEVLDEVDQKPNHSASRHDEQMIIVRNEESSAVCTIS